MTSPANVISLYDSLKAQVDATAAVLKEAWLEHHAAVMRLKESGAWKAYAASWPAYCDSYMPFKWPTYRSHEMDVKVAEMVASLVANVTLSQTEARNLREKLDKVCSKDSTLEGAVYAAVYQETGVLLPSAAQLEAAFIAQYKVKHHKLLEIGGQDVTVGDVLTDNLRYELAEIEGRKTAHIEASMGIETRRVDNVQLEAILPVLRAMGYTPNNNPRDFRVIWNEDKE